MIADLTELAVSEDSASPSECQATYVEGPALDVPGSWGRRCERLLRRLEGGMAGSALAAPSAWAVVQGLQRARAMSDEFGNPCTLDCEGGGGEEALIAAGTPRGTAEEPNDGKKHTTLKKTERLSSADKGEV